MIGLMYYYMDPQADWPLKIVKNFVHKMQLYQVSILISISVICLQIAIYDALAR